MKRKLKNLSLKKITIATISSQYHIIGGAQSTDAQCAETLNPDLCKSEPDTSCTSSTRVPISDIRASCASQVGGSD